MAFMAADELKIDESQITGLKHLDRLRPLLSRLRRCGTARDRAGNRRLFYDEYCLLILLFLFNPIVSSVRALQQASELKKVQRKLGVPRASLGSLSEATSVFDPAVLKRAIAELQLQLPDRPGDRNLAAVKQLAVAVDGTFIQAITGIAEAACFRSPGDGRPIYKWRIHTHFDMGRQLPISMDVRGGCIDERDVLAASLKEDCCYVIDRGYAKFALFNAIVNQHSSYICRIRDNSRYKVLEQRHENRHAAVGEIVEDAIVQVGYGHHRPDHPVRLVVLRISPHRNRAKYGGGSTGNSSDGYLRIATNLLDVPAEVIATLYQRRWCIEVFFRFFKHILGCRHLLSNKPEGIEIQTYMAIIACLLISLWTGRKPTLRTYEMVSFYLAGWADEQEVLDHIAKLKHHS